MSDFVHLHVHSDYSVYDGFQEIDEIVNRVKELGMDAIALTDHGKVGGLISFYKKCNKEGIKPILGCEMYIGENLEIKKDKRYHLTILAKNNIGYRNLIKICSIGHEYLAYNKPRVNFEILKEHKEGLIILSGCMIGQLSQLILNDDVAGAYELAKLYKETWGEDYYLELAYQCSNKEDLQDEDFKEKQKHLISIICQMGRDLDIPLVATNDAHYCVKEKYKHQQVKKSISQNSPLTHKDTDQLYLKSEKEMKALFTHPKMTEMTKMDGEEIIKNSKRIAEKCNVDIVFGEAKLPEFNIKKDEDFLNYRKKSHPDIDDEQCYLEYLSYKGLEWRGFQNKEGYKERIADELETIAFTGFNRYFLIVQEYCKYARSENVRIGAGRGCFLPDSKVLCENDIKEIKNINVGDVVFSHDGSLNEVVGKHEYEIDEEVSIIETNDGRIIKCTKDHRILINRNNNKVWVAAKDIKEGDDIVEIKGEQSRNAKETGIVKKISTKKYNGRVYDLTVKDTHTYNIDGLAVHNSGVGSLVLFVLGVTGIDPIYYNVSMDRFLYAEAEYHLYNSDIGLKQDQEYKTSGRGNRKLKKTKEDKQNIDYIISLIKSNIKGISEEYKDRLKKELKFITKRYTLVEDIVRFVNEKKKGKKNRPNSAVLYTLGLCEEDVDLDVSFNFRFVLDQNQSRISPPDIDIDFEHRDLILKHLCNIYGAEKVALIGINQRYKAKAAVQTVAKAMDITDTNNPDDRRFSSDNDKEAKRLSKLMTNLQITLKQWLGEDEEYKAPNRIIRECIQNMKEEKKKYPELFEIAKAIEGKIRGFGTHAAGVVISQSEITDDVPLQTVTDRNTSSSNIIEYETESGEISSFNLMSTQYDMEEVEELGLLKFDFLQLNNLRQISLTLDLIKERLGSIDFDIDNLKPTDEKVFKTINDMKLEGLFQISGSIFAGGEYPKYDRETGEIRRDKQGKPLFYHRSGVMEIIGCHDFQDIVVANALGRPGPLTLNMPQKYADGKNNPESVRYPHESLKPILEHTYSQLCYQEQLIQMAQTLAGFTFSEADGLRKACAKKKKELLQEIEPKFRKGCRDNNIPDSVIDDMWALCVEFGEYAFNYAHSVAYGFICYQTAYLKTYYPTEFICSLLSTAAVNKKEEELEELENKLKKEYPKLEIISPDVNKSKKTYHPIGDLKIIAPLVSLKGVGKKVSDLIVDLREDIEFFSSVEHFFRIVNSSGRSFVTNSVADMLIDAGAFDIFGSKEEVKLQMKRYKNVRNIVTTNKKPQTDPSVKMGELF